MRCRVAKTFALVGLFGLLGTLLLAFAGTLPFAGTWLDSVELPTFFETSTIALPDGGRLTATIPTQRVQHYGSDGRFRTGWFVDGLGGPFATGLTTDGRVAIYTPRRHEIFLFDLDGRPLGHQACLSPTPNVEWDRCLRSGVHPIEIRVLQPADVRAGEIRLQPVVPVERPNASLAAILLVPFWHPFVAGAIAMVGGVLGWVFRCRAA
jgi:hypothetical protein